MMRFRRSECKGAEWSFRRFLIEVFTVGSSRGFGTSLNFQTILLGPRRIKKRCTLGICFLMISVANDPEGGAYTTRCSDFLNLFFWVLLVSWNNFLVVQTRNVRIIVTFLLYLSPVYTTSVIQVRHEDYRR